MTDNGENVRVFGFPLLHPPPTSLTSPFCPPTFPPLTQITPHVLRPPTSTDKLYIRDPPLLLLFSQHPSALAFSTTKKIKKGLLALKWTYRKRWKSLGWYESERGLCGLAGARAAVGRQQHPAFSKVGASLPHTRRCHGDKKFFSAGHGNVCRSERDTSRKTKNKKKTQQAAEQWSSCPSLGEEDCRKVQITSWEYSSRDTKPHWMFTVEINIISLGIWGFFCLPTSKTVRQKSIFSAA